MMKKLSTLVVIGALFLIISNHTSGNQGSVIMDNGLEYVDLVVGTGGVAGPGSVVVVHITGWLNENGQKGTKFISSYDRGKPVSFKVGTTRVMKAWSLGVRGMRAGGKRLLMVPPELGYGAKGVGETIPPNADLIFEVELLDVKKEPVNP
jgi:FKBP-type peptidyl-prolyl cis-trans isomerase